MPKNRLLVWTLVLVMVLAGVWSAAPFQFAGHPPVVKAQESGTLLMAVGNVRLRAAPNANAEPLGLIGWGEIVTFLATDASGQWYQIDYNGLVGWSLAGWFEVYGGSSPQSNSGPSASSPNPAPSTSTTSQNPVSSSSSGTVRSVGTVRLRTQPNTNGAVLGVMGWGDTALLLGFDASRTWAQVNFDGVIGWVNTGWLEVTPGDVSAPTTSETVSTAPQPTAPSVVAAPAASSTSNGTLMATGNIRLRAQPNTSSEVLANIGWGERVALLDTDASREWVQINYNGTVGWAHRGWFEVVEGSINAPTVDATAPTQAAPSTAGETTVSDAPSTTTVAVVSSTQGNIVRAVGNIRVRAAASTNSQQVGAMGWGDAATLLGADASGQWYQINFNGLTGWVAAGWVEITSGELPHTDTATTIPVGEGDRIIIPALGIDAPLFEMQLVTQPTGGRVWHIEPWEPNVGHLQGTARPGESGNIVLGAHSEYPNGRPGIFVGLHRLNVGNSILVYANGVGREYRVVGKTTVAFDDLHVVYPTPTDRLTLLTCTGYSPTRGIYLSRLIIYAEPVN